MDVHLIVGLVVAIVYGVASGVILLVTRAAGSGRLTRNRYAGIRTGRTQHSETAWAASQGAAVAPYHRLVPILWAAGIASLANGFVAGPYWIFPSIAVVAGVCDVTVAVAATRAVHAAGRQRG